MKIPEPEIHQLSLPDEGKSPAVRPTLSSAAQRLLRNSLPSPNHKSHLPCDRLPQTRDDLNARQRKEIVGCVYSKRELQELSSANGESTNSVVCALKAFPGLQRKPSIYLSHPKHTSPLSNMHRDKSSDIVSDDSIVLQARDIIRKSLIEAKTTELVRSTSVVSITAVGTDVEWLRGAPCVVDLNHCNYISGTPMFFLPPASVLFGLRNGNDDSERVEAINAILQAYYKTNEWSVMECKPGVPCVARCFDGEVFSYVRAVIVEANVIGNFECVCMDIIAHISIEAADISPLPGGFSANALPPSLFVARIRGISTMNSECENNLQNLVRGYFNDADDNMARPLASAVFGRIDLDCIVDWVEPRCHMWLSSILLEQPGICVARDDMASPSIDEAVMAVQEMEENGEFKFYGLEFTADASKLFYVKESSVSIDEKLSNIAIDCCGLDGNPSINNAMDVLSVKPQIDEKPNHVTQETDRIPVLENITGRDNSAYFLSLFKNICSSGDSACKDLFVANSFAFATYARVIMPAENWALVLKEINKHV